MRGAHRGVWCSKGIPLMEAELFAATVFAPCTVWPRTDSAANHARKIQGLKASRNLPDARNRALVPPVSLHIFDVSAQKEGKGSQEGQGNHLVSLPLLSLPSDGGNSSRRWEPAIPVGVRRQSLAAEGGNFLESFIKALPEQRPCAPATESASRSFAARFLLRVPVRRSTAPPCARW